MNAFFIVKMGLNRYHNYFKETDQMSDAHVTIGEVKAQVHRFNEVRDWGRYNTPKNLSAALAVEAAELMEHFQWESSESSLVHQNDSKKREKVEEELADIFTVLIEFCNILKIDLSKTVIRRFTDHVRPRS